MSIHPKCPSQLCRPPTSTTSPPPWDNRSLQTFCDGINRRRGRRTEKYLALLQEITTAVGAGRRGEAAALGTNVYVVVQKMPPEIRKKERIREQLGEILFLHSYSLLLLENFCSYANRAQGTRTKIYRYILSELVPLFLERDAKVEQATNVIYEAIPRDVQPKLADCILQLGKAKEQNREACIEILAKVQASIPQCSTSRELLKAREGVKKVECRSLGGQLEKEISAANNLLSSQCAAQFSTLKKALNRATESREAQEIEAEVLCLERALPCNFDPELKEEISKCSTFANAKIVMLSFAEKRGSTRRLRGRDIYPILSIDGGGIRGIIPATVLCKIEEITGKPTAKLFNLIGGTSTGGILALGLTKPREDRPEEPAYRAQDLLKIYTEDHPQIFRENPNYLQDTSHLTRANRLKEAIYNPKYLAPDLFRKKFEATRLSEAVTDIVITANTVDSIFSNFLDLSVSAVSGIFSFMRVLSGYGPSPIYSIGVDRQVQLFTTRGLTALSYSPSDLFKNTMYDRCLADSTSALGLYSSRRKYSIWREAQGDFLMADVAKVTSAAPTYFPPVRYNEKVLVDGGVLQNNPALPCVFEALDRGVKQENLFVVSLGTGVEPRCAVRNSFGDIATSLWFEATQPHFEEDSTLRSMLSMGATHRFQYRFKDKAPPLDAADPRVIQQLQDCGAELVEANADEIRAVCRALSPESF